MNEAVREDTEQDVEQLARKDGWAPKEEWKGDPDKWKTAEQFVEDGQNILPIMRSKLERMEERLNQSLETNKKFNEFTQKALEKERKEKEKVISELEKAKAQAITDGDGAAAVQAEKQINELRVDEPQEPHQQLDPHAEAWLQDNDWYQKNEDLTAYADGIADRLVEQGYTGKAYFTELSKRVRDRFPDDFGNKNRRKPNSVESGGEPPRESGAKTFDKLPKEAKDAFKQFQRDIPEFTKEQFVAQYDWD